MDTLASMNCELDTKIHECETALRTRANKLLKTDEDEAMPWAWASLGLQRVRREHFESCETCQAAEAAMGVKRAA